jgi:hypothetical protein
MGYNPIAGESSSILSNPRVASQTGRGRAVAAWLAGAALGIAAVAPARPADPPGPLHVVGTLPHGDDLSAIASVGPFLVVASDEGAELGLLEPNGEPNGYRARPERVRLEAGEGELDVEAMARAGDELFVLGSHSIKRRLIDPTASRARNRERLADVSDEPLRQRIYRLSLDPRTGRLTASPRWVSLRPVLERDRIVGSFTRIPAEENGVNLEGLAADERGLLLAFRSPVLRRGFVPVMRTAWGEEPPAELLLLDLEGRGIRSLERVEGGFLLVARHERAGEPSEAIYFWDGADGTPGAGERPARIERLLELRPPPGGTTEGLCVTAEEREHWEVVVVHDGVPGGHPVRLRVARPHSTR